MAKHQFKESFVYGLICPLTKDVRYIGISSVDAWGRYQNHIKEAKNEECTTHKARWIRKVFSYGLLPEFVIVESGIWTHDQLCQREIWWIAQYRAWGHDLTNVTKGGDGIVGAVRTDVWRSRLSAATTRTAAAETAEDKKNRADKRLETMIERYGTTSPTAFIDPKKRGSTWRGRELPQKLKDKMSEGQRKKWERIKADGRYEEVCNNIALGTRQAMSKLPMARESQESA